jgi:hypothetical protein
MKDQHRATDEQWKEVNELSHLLTCSCILELRDRIKALEASQPEHLIDPERERTAKEFMQAAGFAPRWSDFDRFFAGIEAPKDVKPAKSNHPAKPGGSLVERVANAMDGATEWQSRQAIREIAAWLQKRYGRRLATIDLEQEAER